MNEFERTPYRPRLSYYHANAKGTGSAIRFELRPATEDAEGCIFACIASQATVGSRTNGVCVFPRFDWKNAVTLKLDIDDLSRMLEVFRGMAENISDGKGLYHTTGDCNTIIKLEHRIEPIPGYGFSVSRKRLDAAQAQYMMFFFSMNEALGLSTAIEQSLGLIAFGVPRPDGCVRIARDQGASVYGADNGDTITDMDTASGF